MDNRLEESVQVLQAMGESGWACYLTREEASHEWVAAVRGAGWSPLNIRIADHSESRGQDDVSVTLTHHDLAELLSQRFPPGRPMHLLLTDTNERADINVAVSVGKPWVLGTVERIEQPPGYTQLLEGAWHWWIRDDHQHLSPGITERGARTPETAVEAASPGMISRVVEGRLRPLAIHVAYRLPGPLRARLAGKRHLEAVNANQPLLTHGAFLTPQETTSVEWLTPDGLPPIPASARTLGPLAEHDIALAR